MDALSRGWTPGAATTPVGHNGRVPGRSILLFDRAEREQLAGLGDVRRPSIADVFVAVMSKGQTPQVGGERSDRETI